MPVLDLENKRVFLIASQNQTLVTALSSKINQHIADSTIFTSRDGSDVLFKIDNAPPHILILDKELPKIDSVEVAQRLVTQDKYPQISIIMISHIPDTERFVDEVVTGKIQYLTDIDDDIKFQQMIARGLNRLADSQNLGYKILFLVKGDTLFKEGELGKSAYIVKSGEMKATKKQNDQITIIGKIQPGEFVGEMSHINNEPRFATVIASHDCELIEIPFGVLDFVLFTKPAWAKALVMTLSKRLRNAFKQ